MKSQYGSLSASVRLEFTPIGDIRTPANSPAGV